MMTARYRAFLSYSHRDAAVARRVHGALEGWRVDAGLVGRATPVGAVPATLRPVFRDREDLAGGGQLSDAIRAALADSACLIVLCSPAAAASDYVDAEIRAFQALGRSARIIPLIVDGEPGSDEAACFPPALCAPPGAGGDALARLDAPLAADAREHGDGFRRALAKVVAGVLGLPFDEVARRAERAARRRQRVLVAVAAMMSVLALAAGGFGWLAEQRRAEAEHNYQAAVSAADAILGEVGEELIRVEGIGLDTTRRVIGRASQVFDDLSAALPDARELKLSKIAALLVFAKAYGAKGDHAGELGAAREGVDAAVALQAARPDDEGVRMVLAMARRVLGMALASRGDKVEAIEVLQAAVDGFDSLAGDADAPGARYEHGNALLSLSMLLVDSARADAAAAADSYLARAIAEADAMAAADPDDMRYRALRITTRTAQADRLRRAGDAAAARAAYVDVEAALRDEVARSPDVPQFRAMLSAVHTQLADVLDALGDAAGAQAVRERAAATVARLARRDGENRSMRAQHAGNLAVQGEALAREGKVDAAVALFAESQATLEALLASQPEDAGAALALDLALSRAATAFNAEGYYESAEAAARRLLDLREAALARTPADAEAVASVLRALHALAEAVEGGGALAAALALRERQLTLEAQLAAQGVERRSLRAEVHFAAGVLAWRLSRRAEAIPHYAQHNALLRALLAEAPQERNLRIRLGHGLLNLGELRVLTGDAAGARAAFDACLQVRQALVDAGADAPARLTELAWAQARLAQFGDDPAARWAAVESLLVRADAALPLGDLEEELLTVARIVGASRALR